MWCIAGTLRFRDHMPAAPRSKNFAADEARRWTPMHADGERLNDLSGQVIGGAFAVLDTPVTGVLAKVDENAPAFAVRARACPGEGRGLIGYATMCRLGVPQERGGRRRLRGPAGRGRASGCAEHRQGAGRRRHAPGLIDPGVGCNVPRTAKRPACSPARWLISPNRAGRPNAWRTTGEPHGPIGVHRRPSPCFICGKFFLVLPRRKRATRVRQ